MPGTDAAVVTEQGAASSAAEQPALTDEQIVGLEPAPGATAEETASAPETQEAPAQAVTQEKKTAEAATQPEQVQQDGRVIPAEFREILKANPKLRDMFFRQLAYQEVFPTVAEARAFREQFPGGLEDAKSLLQEVQEVSELDELYYGGTPEGHQKLVDGLLQDDPKAFGQLVPIAVERWAQADPKGYSRTMGTIVGETFTANRLPEHIEALRQQLKEGNTEAAGKLAEELATWVNGFVPGGRDQQRGDPREAALAREREAFEKEKAGLAQAKQQEFFTGYLNEVTDKATVTIKEFVGALVPAEISEGARNRIIGDIFNAINSTLGQNRAFMAERDRVLRSGDKARAVEYVLARAKQILPQVGRKILSEWTGNILAANKKAIEAKRGAASKVDIGAGGAPGTAGKKALKPGEVDYGKMSDIDILNA